MIFAKFFTYYSWTGFGIYTLFVIKILSIFQFSICMNRYELLLYSCFIFHAILQKEFQLPLHKINLWIVWFRRKVMIPALSDIIIWPGFCITFSNVAVCMTFANRKWNKRDCFHKYWNCFQVWTKCYA